MYRMDQQLSLYYSVLVTDLLYYNALNFYKVSEFLNIAVAAT
jgi:hypothetical protein